LAYISAEILNFWS